MSTRDFKRKQGKLEEIHEVYFHKDFKEGANKQFHIYLRDKMIPTLGGKSALELGCGSGDWTKILCQRYKVIDIVEGSKSLLKSAIELCKNSSAQVNTHLSMVENFNPLNKKWEHIFLTFLLEHLESPEIVLKRIYKWLQKDGKLFIAVPNAHSIHRILAYRMGLIEDPSELSENDVKVGHKRVYTPELICKQVTSAGFSIHSFIPIGLKVLNLEQMNEWSQVLVAAMCKSGDLSPENSAYIGIIAELD